MQKFSSASVLFTRRRIVCVAKTLIYFQESQIVIVMVQNIIINRAFTDTRRVVTHDESPFTCARIYYCTTCAANVRVSLHDGKK